MKELDREVHLDRVTVDGCVLHRRSAILRTSIADPGAPGACAWRVHVSCAHAPARLVAGPTALQLEARLISGRPIHAVVAIVSRHDSAFGTELVLGGIGPVDPLLPSDLRAG